MDLTNLAVSLALAVILWGMVGGQQTDAVCMPAYDWLNNSQGQSPCFIATNLIAECDPYRNNVSALHHGGLDYYPGPDPAINFFPTNCTCNTITYSLLSACSVCQGFVYIEWQRWAEKCPSVYITEYPERIPDAVSVPAWAYLNVAVSKNFSISAAAGDTDPDITAGSPTGPAIPAWPNATLPPSPAPSPVPSNTFSQGRQHSFDLYALIGIVTGGVLVFAVAFGLAETYYMRRKRRRQAAASGGENSEERGEAQVGATDETQMGTTGEALVTSEAGDSTSPAFVRDMPSMPPIPEGDSSEIQLVARDYEDPGPEVQTSQRSTGVSFRTPDEQPVAGPSRIRLDS